MNKKRAQQRKPAENNPRRGTTNTSKEKMREKDSGAKKPVILSTAKKTSGSGPLVTNL